MFHKDIKELQNTIQCLKSQFKEEEFSVEIISLKNEGKDINALPFLQI
jgi:hypothetical protein